MQSLSPLPFFVRNYENPFSFLFGTFLVWMIPFPLSELSLLAGESIVVARTPQSSLLSSFRLGRAFAAVMFPSLGSLGLAGLMSYSFHVTFRLHSRSRLLTISYLLCYFLQPGEAVLLSTCLNPACWWLLGESVGGKLEI